MIVVDMRRFDLFDLSGVLKMSEMVKYFCASRIGDSVRCSTSTSTTWTLRAAHQRGVLLISLIYSIFNITSSTSMRESSRVLVMASER